MITDNLLITKIDLDAERRRALAKVYSLLLRLAESAEKKAINIELLREKKAEESTSAEINPLTKEADLTPSQHNIPP